MMIYSTQANSITDLLNSFVRAKKIDPKQSDKTVTKYIKFLKEKQFEILNSSISEEIQSVVFNAMRNLIVIVDDIQNELRLAFERHENPTTAEKCLQIMPFILNLSNDLDRFGKMENRKIMELLHKDTRLLRRKGRDLSFLRSIEQEMEGIDLTKKEIEEIVDKYNSNLESFLLVTK